MGVITLAQDRRLGRQVAIKELLTSTPSLRARFEREALLTARLEHPAIVTVHEAGRWPSGEPFYAMRIVRGESLNKILSRAKLVAERLALVSNVMAAADAIAYAHGQHVIHRDLKPHNIMVGDFGETVVIDWGLAKDLDNVRDTDADVEVPSVDATIAGSVVGTPLYMPPEQANGETVDERADVYAIGAVLYHVLAGKSPYHDETRATIVDAVRTRPPIPLASHVSDIPADLVAIVERAMARDVASRYPNGRALADDLRRFQTGQLVAAHRYSAFELVRRWIGRHRAAVAVAVIALVVSGGLGIAAIRRIIDEREAADEARVVAIASRKDATGLAGFMLHDVHDSLASLERLDLLEPVGHKAIDYYTRHPEVIGTDAGRAHVVLADALFAKGDVKGALAEFRAAADVFALVSARHPDKYAIARDYSAMHNRIGDALVSLGDIDHGLAEYRTAYAIVGLLSARDPSNPAWQIDAAFTRRKIGEQLERRGDVAGALVEYRAAQQQIESVAATKADDNLAREIEVGDVLIADALRERGDTAGALRAYEAARTIAERLVATKPSGLLESDVVVALSALAELHHERGETAAEIEAAVALLPVAEHVAARDPKNAVWQRMLVFALDDSGVASKDLDAAARLFERAHMIASTLASGPQPTPSARDDLATTEVNRANNELARGHGDAAITGYRAALAIHAQLVAKDPDQLGYTGELAMDHRNLANVLRAAEAIDHAKAAIAWYRRLVGRAPDEPTYGTNLAATLARLAELTTGSSAMDAAREAVAVAKRYTDTAPARTVLADCEVAFGDVLARSGDPAGARSAYDAALAIYAEIPAAAAKLAIVRAKERR